MSFGRNQVEQRKIRIDQFHKYVKSRIKEYGQISVKAVVNEFAYIKGVRPFVVKGYLDLILSVDDKLYVEKNGGVPVLKIEAETPEQAKLPAS